ncbi:MAG TPA: hypothetical protein VLD39_05105 [Gammaproteobacteria bacterium]|nr:hypothetical protein [Gammaproteobacteria bacterium]
MSGARTARRGRLGWAGLAVALGLSASGSSAVEIARMKLPADAAARMTRHAATGLGGFNSGRYELGGFSGEFERSESRLSLFGSGFAANRGKSRFSLDGPGLGSPTSGECEFAENVVVIGVVTFDPKKLVYSCTIGSGDGRYEGRLLLGEPSSKTLGERALAYDLRRGEAELGGIRISIASVHELEGSWFSSPAPVGYLFTLAGDVVGAVELTDSDPTVLLPEGRDEHERVIALTIAVALAVLRDPASSALAE